MVTCIITYRHACIHACIHTYTHTCIPTSMLLDAIFDAVALFGQNLGLINTCIHE